MRFKIMKQGATRNVFLIGRYAIKIPRLVEWRLFLNGLLANMQEVTFSETKWEEFCPVLFHFPLGFMVVMKRCDPLTRYQWDSFDVDAFRENVMFVENKMDSFGILNGKIVAVDYGS
jgi:hypothetical protein